MSTTVNVDNLIQNILIDTSTNDEEFLLWFSQTTSIVVYWFCYGEMRLFERNAYNTNFSNVIQQPSHSSLDHGFEMKL